MNCVQKQIGREARIAMVKKWGKEKIEEISIGDKIVH